jgi:FG-GAP-like repeat/FG-GAP repeat
MWFQLRHYLGQSRHSFGLAALALLTLSVPCAVAGFQAPLSFDTGPAAYTVAVWDFNGDGIPDLVVANAGNYYTFTGGNLSVMLGKGDGTFQPAVNYVVGDSPTSVAVGDLNGDGIVDLAVSDTAGNQVSVLLGRGDGTFDLAGMYPAGLGARSVAIADFNGDGRLDLAVADQGTAPDYTDGGLSVLLGNGDGTFRPPVQYATSVRPLAVAVGDFNRDGIPDLAVTNYTVSVLLGNGDGTFQAPANYAAGRQAWGITVGDLNGDGILDLAVGDVGSRSVGVLLGKGDGTFQPARYYAAGGTGDFIASVAIADLNGDGIPDLVAAAAGTSFTVGVLLGKGDGSFQPAHSYPVGPQPNFVAVGDFNGDGKPDLAVANSFSNNVSVLLGNGDATFQTAPHYGAGDFPQAIVARDLNGDGIPDLAMVVGVGGGNSVSVLLGKAGGAFQAAVQYPLGKTSGSLAVADLNGDGIPDLVVPTAGTSSNFSISVLLGNGDGSFQAAVESPVGKPSRSLAVADLNGDGIPDLVLVHVGTSPDYSDGSVSVLLGNGDGTFQAGVDYPAGNAPISVAVGDFNGDGRLDLAVANADGSKTVSILLGLGNATFAVPVPYAVGVSPLLNYVATSSVLVVQDLNNDGIVDLAVAGPPGVSILLGNGDGTFKGAKDYSAGAGSSSLVVGDFNGDGLPDLAVLDFSGVRLLLGNGDGSFQTTPNSYLTGAYPAALTAADFNGDGSLDLAVAVLRDKEVSMLFNDGHW